MNARLSRLAPPRRSFRPAGALAALAAALVLTACGGGGDDDPAADGGGAVPVPPAAVSCDTTLFAPGADIRTPEAADWAKYAGDYAGDTGTYDTNFVFQKSGTFTMTLTGDGALSYNGGALTLKSACVINEAPVGAAPFQLLVMHYDLGHVDLFDSGELSGIAPDASVALQGQKL